MQLAADIIIPPHIDRRTAAVNVLSPALDVLEQVYANLEVVADPTRMTPADLVAGVDIPGFTTSTRSALKAASYLAPDAETPLLAAEQATTGLTELLTTARANTTDHGDAVVTPIANQIKQFAVTIAHGAHAVDPTVGGA